MCNNTQSKYKGVKNDKKNKVPVILIIVNITITKCSRMATIYFYGGHPWEGVDAHHANVAKDN